MNHETSGDDWFPLDELTGRLAALAWAEARVAGILDQWSRIEPHDGVCAVLARAGAHHAWHSEILTASLPTSPALASAATPVPPSEAWQRTVVALESVLEPERTVTRLAALVRVIDPWFARETAALLACARPVADAALTRWLRFVEIDHHDDGAATAELLDALAGNTVDIRDRALLQQLELTTRRPPPAPPD